MRTFFLAACGAVLAAAPAAAATRNFGVEGFTKVRVDGPYRVRLATGTAPFAKADGSSAALDLVSIEVEGSTLVVHPNRSSWGGYPGQDVGPVVISLGTHDLNAAWLNGSGMLAIDKVKGLTFDLSVQGSGAASIGRADVDQLRIAVAGSGSASVAGQAGKTSAMVRGVSSVDLSGLNSKDAVLSADGSATIKAAVSNSAKIDGSGPATISLTGGPACTVRLSGAATISGCGSTH
jgi:Putative auto-transporter adhesin, head GIN domain